MKIVPPTAQGVRKPEKLSSLFLELPFFVSDSKFYIGRPVFFFLQGFDDFVDLREQVFLGLLKLRYLAEEGLFLRVELFNISVEACYVLFLVFGHGFHHSRFLLEFRNAPGLFV